MRTAEAPDIWRTLSGAIVAAPDWQTTRAAMRVNYRVFQEELDELAQRQEPK